MVGKSRLRPGAHRRGRAPGRSRSRSASASLACSTGRRTPRRRAISRASSSATASASLVLPVPPGPVSVTRRTPSRRRIASTAATSSRRPTSALDAAGSRGRGADSPALEGERRVVAEHRALELAQSRTGLDAQLVERACALLIGGERVLLATGAVQREHDCSRRRSRYGSAATSSSRSPDDLAVLTEREPRIDAELERLQPQILEPGGGGAHGAVTEVGERVASPERRARPRAARRHGGRAARQRVARLGEQPLEPRDVELLRLDTARGRRCHASRTGRSRLPGAGRGHRPGAS